MSQVNFVSQINMFMEYGRRNGLTSYERMFWLGLFHVANMWAQRSPNHDWPDDFFPVSNSEIEAWSGLEERNIRAIRNRLKQIGLIDFKKGDGRKSDPEYRIYYLRYISYKIVPDAEITECKNVPDSVGGCVCDNVGDTAGDKASATGTEHMGNGCKIAADSVGEPYYPTYPNRLSINTNRGTINAEKNADGRTNAALREQARARAFGSRFGLVDMDSDFSGTDGLVRLPWDDKG